MKTVQRENRCDMKRVQHEKCATRKKCYSKIMQSEKNETRKKVQQEKSAT